MARLARAEVFAADEIAILHVMNRTVRRCYLLGDDPLTGKNYDHRKAWMEDELQGNMGAIHPKHRVHQSTLSPITAFRVGTWVLAVTWLTETSSVCQRRFVRFTRYTCRFRL